MKIKRPEPGYPIPKNAKIVFEGSVFSVYQWKQKMFDGSHEMFDMLKRADSVNVIPVIDGKIILSKQRQPGGKEFIGSLGGRVENGETPIETAKRELKEESGLVAKRFRLLFAFQPYEKMDWAVYTFLAYGVKKAGKASPDKGEKIKLLPLTFDEFVAASAKPNFRDKELSLKIFQSLSDKKLMAKYRRMFGAEK